MHHTEHHKLQHFAEKKQLNRMYAHLTIQHVGVALIGIFIPIYFYTIGYTIQEILLYELLYALFYILVTPLAVELIRISCVNRAFLISFPFRIIFFLLLVYVPEYPWLFYILPAILALRFSVFNLAFHYNMIVHSDRNNAGRNFASIFILFSLGSFLAPYLGALIISAFGFEFITHVAIGILLLSIFPLFGYEDVCPVRHKISHARIWKNIFSRKQYLVTLSHLGYAVEALIGAVLWPLFLFIFLASYEKVGLITSASLIIATAGFYLIGKWTDSRNQKDMIKKGTRMYAASWITRILGIYPFFIVFSDVFRNIAEKYMLIPWSAYSYEVAKHKRPFEFIATREISINIFRILAIPFLILLFDFLPVAWAFAMSFILAAGFTLLIPKITQFVRE